MLLRIVQKHVHLPGVGVGQLAYLQIDHDQGAELPMEKQEIDAIPLLPDARPSLSADEGKVPTEFEQEFFQMPQQSLLQVRLGVFVLQVEKF